MKKLVGRIAYKFWTKDKKEIPCVGDKVTITIYDETREMTVHDVGISYGPVGGDWEYEVQVTVY